MADQPTGIGEDDLWTDSDCSPGVYYCELVTRFKNTWPHPVDTSADFARAQ
jgi:hypothetical protein